MFLFEGEFGNIVHTGDCRLTPDCLQYLPLKYLSKKGRETLCHLDYLFLDCTFGRCSLKLPSKQSAIQQVINCIWKHPNAPVVYLACDLLGQEEIPVEVSRTFGSKIYVDKTNNSEFYQALLLAAPEIISQDASCHFQVVEGFPRLCERAREKLADARANLQPEPLFIRPSTQWYAGIDRLEMTQRQNPKLTEAEKDEFGIWHVCYSMHSSREELEWALQLLQPKWVISTTPPCRAMELDYVKNHCFKTHITPDDPLWKLLKVHTGKSSSLLPSTASVVLKNGCVSTSVIGASTSEECNLLQSKSLSINHFKLKLDLPPPSRAPPITLFGRARLGLQDHDVLQGEKSEFTIAKNEAEVLSTQENIVGEEASSLQEGSIAIAVQEPSLRENVLTEQAASLLEDNKAELSIEKLEVDVERNISCTASSKYFSIAEPSVGNSEEADIARDLCIGSSRSFNASLRKLYRSMNVPVPRPLPSLVQLVSSSKRIKMSSDQL